MYLIAGVNNLHNKSQIVFKNIFIILYAPCISKTLSHLTVPSQS